MSEKNEAPALPGEVWRGAVTLIGEGAFCAVTVDGDAVKTWALWGATWREVGSLVEKRALAAWALSLRVSLAAALRTADRLRHGQTIEGDDVCPNEMRAEKAEELAAAERAYRIAEVAYTIAGNDESKTKGAASRWRAAEAAYLKAHAALIEAGGKP